MSSGISTEKAGPKQGSSVRQSTRSGRTVEGPDAAPDAAFRPWHFFVLVGLIAATAAMLLARQPSPANLILVSITIGAAALAAIAFHRTLSPLVSSELGGWLEQPGQRSRAALEREKTLVLRSIKELEFDRAMGKVSAPDFEEMAGRMRARALGLMKQLDEDHTGYRELIERELESRLKRSGVGRVFRPAGAADNRQEVEDVMQEGEASGPTADAGPAAGVRQVPSTARAESVEGRALGAGLEPAGATELCDACGARNDADARFCKSCGSRLGNT